jgi:hypothetical protein
VQFALQEGKLDGDADDAIEDKLGQVGGADVAACWAAASNGFSGFPN